MGNRLSYTRHRLRYTEEAVREGSRQSAILISNRDLQGRIRRQGRQGLLYTRRANGLGPANQYLPKGNLHLLNLKRRIRLVV